MQISVPFWGGVERLEKGRDTLMGNPFGTTTPVKNLDAAFFAYSWKLLAYSGAFVLTVAILAFLLTVGAFLLPALAFLLTVGAFVLTVGKCI